jgi:hypothetical protein
MRLDAQLVPISEIGTDVRREMLALMRRHFVNVRHEVFEKDLAEKHWAILVFEPATGGLCGFSTQMLLDLACDGRPIKALFSGDTIIDRAYWGDRALSRVWGRLALSLIDAWPNAELYWFLISQGYKTYRFLPIFFREYYPRFDALTPAWAQSVIAALGREKFAVAFSPTAWVVRATPTQYRLRSDIAALTPERLGDPHVRFFVERNPGHASGDELCCIAPLTRQNFTAAAYRVIGNESAVSRCS